MVVKMKKDVVLKVDEPRALNGFLTEKLPSLTKKDIKALLTHKSVVVDGMVRTKFDYPLKKGQKVVVDYNNRYEFLRINKIKIIYEDEFLIALDKPPGLLTVAADDKAYRTVFTLMNEYVKLSDRHSRIYIVHRLDRDTSGVLVVAKNEDFKNKLQDNWNGLALTRAYRAVVEGVPSEKSGVIKQKLVGDKNLVMRNRCGGETAITEYSVIRESMNNAMLDIRIKTGKKNQIRAAMRDIGHSIAGDKKYGAKTNPLKRMGLHANKLELKNPETGTVYSFEAKTPAVFNYLFKEKRLNEN